MTAEKKFLFGIGVVTVCLVILGTIFLGQDKKTVPQSVDQTVLYANNKNTTGDQNAPVKIIEFGDFQCPACGAAHPIVKKILEKNKEKVYFVFRHYPLSIHKNAKIAAQAAEAAASQGKFWEMHDLLYTNQKDWEQSNDARGIFTKYATQLNLDLEKFKQDIDQVKGTIEQDYADGNKLGVNSTPTFFINGAKYPGVIQETQFQQLIDNASK